MKETLEKKTTPFVAKPEALLPDIHENIYSTGRSSLHQIINTKEKADAFMKQLKDLEMENYLK